MPHLDYRNLVCKYNPNPTYLWQVIVLIRIIGTSMCVSWSWGHYLGIWPWHNIGQLKQIKLTWEKLMSGLEFWALCALWLDLRIWHWVGQDTPLCHGQQLCKESSKSNLHEKNNDLDKNFSYTCIVTLTLEIWPWAKVKGHWIPLSHRLWLFEWWWLCNQNPTHQWEAMCQTRLLTLCARDLDLNISPCVKAMTPLCHGHEWCYHLNSACK